jgi:hypothetical protein
VYRQQQRDLLDRDTVLAWQMANFSRAKKLPNLKQVLAKRDVVRKPSQTPGQMRSVLESLGMKAKPLSEGAKKALKYIKVN